MASESSTGPSSPDRPATGQTARASPIACRRPAFRERVSEVPDAAQEVLVELEIRLRLSELDRQHGFHQRRRRRFGWQLHEPDMGVREDERGPHAVREGRARLAHRPEVRADEHGVGWRPVSYTHLTLPTI